MKYTKIWAGLSILLAYFLLTSNAFARGSLPEFTELVADNAAAVVNISTTTTNKSKKVELPPNFKMPEGTPFDDLFRHFFGQGGQGGQPYETHSLGSGFVLSSDGYILTNHHVIKGADEIIVRFNDRSELEAKVLGSDERSDVALLKVEAKGLTAVKLGDSENLKVG